ncbi:MAG: hypothetical protein Q7V01_11685 [Vicinamibacterales bacterium]|nr:hypothetical protein [Vicinamibacterales bacterium]
MDLRTWGAWTTTGLALWASLGELDVAGGADGAVRVAMLPPLPLLAAAILLAWLAGWVLGLGAPARSRADETLPLYALVTLVLPYLPWLPDALPVLRVFAGPARYIVWLLVVAQVVWSAFGAGRGRRVVARVRAWSAARLYVTIFAANLLVFGTAALVVAPSGLRPGGDEPHYLIITQSLLQDGDLQIENNHQQRDYRQYYNDVLEPHALARGVNGAVYSVHHVGLPVLVAPFFALGGYPAVVLAMLLMAAAAAALAWVWVRRHTGSVAAATFACAAVSLSVAYLFSAGTVYPETAAALAVMLAVAVGLRGDGATTPAPTVWRSLMVACAAGALPWLSAKYAVMSAALIAVAVRRVWADRAAAGSRQARLAALVLPYAVSIAGWFLFFQLTWGSPWPSAAYGGASETQMSLWNLRRGVPGLLFDQEYGLLSYTPVLGLAVLGSWHQWRAGGAARVLAVEVGLVFGVLLATVAGHAMWWGGSSVPARFLVSGLPLLALPVAWEYRRVAAQADRRAAYRLLLLVGIGISAAVLLSPGMSALANRRDGVSRLLQWLSPDWHLWAHAPDFIAQPLRWGLVQAVIWIGCLTASALLFAALSGRSPRAAAATRVGRGLAFLRADATLGASLVLVTLLTPLALGGQLKPDVRPEDRARIGLLESFDPHARPVAIRYDPLSAVSASAVPSLFELSAQPGSRRSSQPVPLLLNARFGLPAGRYRVVLSPLAGPDAPTLSGGLVLQGGRHGGTLAAWSVEAPPGSSWNDTFDLPVDVGFIGFRASGRLTSAVGNLRVIPLRVIPTLDRPAASDVLGSATLGDRFVFLFHDGASFPEEDGFWVRGAAPASVSVLSRTGRLTLPVELRLRNGPVANTVHIVTPGAVTDVVMGPGEIRTVRLTPTPLDGTLRMIIHPQSGFVPADHEPGNRDTRLLGCWVEVVG